MSAVLKRRLSGVVFLLVLAGLVGFCIAQYQKAFTPVVRVTLEADQIGNQLSPPSDVKLRGLVVGEARAVSSTGDGAEIDLALDPEHIDLIPANVQARLLPKTLFGEKYVDLVVPEDPAGDRLAEGDVIPQDRSETARETEEALNSLLPLLEALHPDQLSITLNALSDALRGRGDRIGENLVLVEGYLREFNPEIPALGENFAGLADFADNLEATTPDLVRVLDNLSFVNRSLVDQQEELNSFLTSTTGFTEEMDDFLRDNERRLVTLARDSLPPLQVYARYSPEYPCLLAGLNESNDFISDTFGGLQPGLHITLEFVPAQEPYKPQRDEPRYLDDRGPRCYGLPDPGRPAEDINFQDGFRDENPPGSTKPPGGDTSGPEAAIAADPARALASPAGQRRLVEAVVAPVMGVSADEVPDLAHLLFGPVARGTAVGLSRGSS